MQTTFIPLRIFFEKRGRIKYISHLDTMRSFTRALGRSGLPFWFTEGFNPHLYITFALPLPLGCEALNESFDIRLTQNSGFSFRESGDDILTLADVVLGINECLPPGFRALKAAEPANRPSVIEWAEYEINLHYESNSEKAVVAMRDFAQKPSIEVLKRTKKGENLIDIKPHMSLVDLTQNNDSLKLILRLAAGINLNIAAALFLEAFHEHLGEKPVLTQITRLRLMDKEYNEFE